MNNREALFFTCKCLSLGQFPQRKSEIGEQIRSGTIEWERVVWISTNHMVLPAMHLQLKRAGLMQELPDELIGYMEEITEMNRERNLQIIDQAVDLNDLLVECGLTPVFLKGTAHLLDGLYTDIAERMVGDIDLLVAPGEVLKTAEILQNASYGAKSDPASGLWLKHKHYPRLIHPSRIAGVEIHHRLLVPPYHTLLQADQTIAFSRQSKIQKASILVLDDKRQVIHNILNVQINDHYSFRGLISLRQMYDLLLLSSRVPPSAVVGISGNSSYHLNVNLSITNQLLGPSDALLFKRGWQTALFYRRVIFNVENPRWGRFSGDILYLWTVLKLMTSDKSIRQIVCRRLREPDWYIKHLKRYFSSE